MVNDDLEASLLVVLLDLFMAGGDTTSATLYWAFLYMVLNERVQKAVQLEIDSVIGNETPRLEHRKLLGNFNHEYIVVIIIV